MKTENTNRKNKPKATDKQQNIIGLRALCISNGKIWNENFSRLDGNKNLIFYEIDGKKNQNTLRRPDSIEYLLERMEEYKVKTGKFSAIAKMILNVPGKWENSFPDLAIASIKESNKLALYCEIDEEENLQFALELLKKQATDKISILLC